MPSNSPWPVTLAVAMSGVFAMLLIGHVLIAAGFVAACGLVLVAWHAKDPEEAS
jgi:hypothetical protein